MDILNDLYGLLKSVNKDELKVAAVLLSGAISAAILLKAVKPFTKFIGVMFVSLSLAYASYRAVLDIANKGMTMLSFILIWSTAFVSYPLAKGFMDLLVSVIDIVSNRIKSFAKTYTPSFSGLFNKKKNNDTI